MIYTILFYLPRLLLKFFLLSLVVLFFVIVYFFQQQEVILNNYIIINPFYNFITSFPIWIYLVFCFIALSIICVLIFIPLSLYYTIKRNRNAILKLKYDKIFAALLSDYFISEHYKTQETKNNFYKTIKQFLRTRIQLLSFIDTYLHIQEVLSVD